MSVYSSQVGYYLERYRQGDDNAFSGLVELDHEILPGLMAEFVAASDPELRAFLINVIWEHRQHSVIPWLGTALREGEKPVWRQAMDGLVALACPEALMELRMAIGRQFPKERDTVEFSEWLEEAVEQANARLATPADLTPE